MLISKQKKSSRIEHTTRLLWNLYSILPTGNFVFLFPNGLYKLVITYVSREFKT